MNLQKKIMPNNSNLLCTKVEQYLTREVVQCDSRIFNKYCKIICLGNSKNIKVHNSAL